MVTITGTYENGQVKLDKDFTTKKPVKVLITFLEDVQSQSGKGLSLSDFSFSKSQENLRNFKGSLSDSVIEERRREL